MKTIKSDSIVVPPQYLNGLGDTILTIVVAATFTESG